jgi:MoxR-like ATPase
MTATQDREIIRVPSDQTAGSLRAICTELSERYYERGPVIRVLMQTVLAGQHALLLGAPGTAKSDLARDLTSRFGDAVYRELLLSKFTDPKKIFGPLDVAALVRGEYRQQLERGVTGAHIVFFDEIFKCGDGALNETLAYLNERTYHPESGGAPIKCPLISAITASNELPADAATSAVYDRLLVRIEVGYLVDPANFTALVRSAVRKGTAQTRTTITLAELLHAVNVAVPAVDVPDEVVDRICELRTALRHKELITSDRRWKQAVRLLQAGAWLDGRDAVEEEDLRVLTHVLWDSPAQRGTVEREVLAVMDPAGVRVLDLVDDIAAIESELEAKTGQSEETLSTWAVKEARSKLTKAAVELKSIKADARANGRSTRTVDEAMQRQKAVLGRLLTEALGISASALRDED